VSRITRLLLDLIIAAVVVIGLLGVWTAVTVLFEDPVKPTAQEGAYTDWGKGE
jgi:hypothetical protein